MKIISCYDHMVYRFEDGDTIGDVCKHVKNGLVHIMNPTPEKRKVSDYFDYKIDMLALNTVVDNDALDKDIYLYVIHPE